MKQTIQALEYIYAAFGEDSYFVQFVDESQPLGIRREPISYEQYREYRGELKQLQVRAYYTDAGVCYWYDTDKQVEMAIVHEQGEADAYDFTIASFLAGTGRV